MVRGETLSDLLGQNNWWNEVLCRTSKRRDGRSTLSRTAACTCLLNEEEGDKTFCFPWRAVLFYLRYVLPSDFFNRKHFNWLFTVWYPASTCKESSLHIATHSHALQTICEPLTNDSGNVLDSWTAASYTQILMTAVLSSCLLVWSNGNS